ncbi:MAG: hypothetical protein KTU85_12395, partial [Acidimicrobiia bacterium]|nr:hypothetical protein [Acidimicrobiia bacterium]
MCKLTLWVGGRPTSRIHSSNKANGRVYWLSLVDALHGPLATTRRRVVGHAAVSLTITDDDTSTRDNPTTGGWP